MANKAFHTGTQGKKFRDKERVYPTGCRLLNTAIGMFDPITGLPGVPQATVVEAFGPNASLKTALWESLAGNIHKIRPEGRILAVLPEEPDYQRFIDAGIDLDRIDCWTYFNPSNPNVIMSAEEGLNLTIEAISDPTNNYEMVVIDSIKALMTSGQTFDKKGEFRDLAETNPLAARANLMNQYTGLFAVHNKCRAILFATNQTSDSIGPSYLTGGSFKTQTSAGRGKEHWAKLRIECNSTVPDATDKVEKGLYDNKIYDRIKPIYYIQKNKYGFPFRKVMTEFCLREKRFLNEVNCLAAAEMLGIIERAGNSNWKIQGVNCKGRDTAEQYLHDNPEIEEKIWREIDSRHIELFGTPKSAKSKEALE